MAQLQTLTKFSILLAVAMSLQGCIGFSGPNGIRNSIARSQDVRLEKEFGVDVGPLGIALANAFASQYVPVSLDGVWSVSFGEYNIRPTGECSLDEFHLDYVELKGWESFVRIREDGSMIKLMHNARGSKINKMLFMEQEGDQLMIVRVDGNFDKIMDNILESELIDDIEFLDMPDEPYGEPAYAMAGSDSERPVGPDPPPDRAAAMSWW